MKLESISIRAFGKLKNFEMNFSDGVNLIYGDNESGKTTIMAFLRMMFYGSGKTTANLSRSPRKKYEPFNSDAFGGSVVFTHNNVKYRLEREFKKSDSQDRVTLLNLNTGTKEQVESGNEIGLRFFNLSSSAFDRTLYVGGFINCTGDSIASGEIGGKLANLVSSGEEEVSFETISARLASARQVYFSKSGQIGISDKLKARIRLLNEQLIDASQNDQEKREKSDRIASLENLILEMEKQCDSIRQDISLSEKYETGKALRKIADSYKELDRLEEELDKAKLQISVGDSVADETFFANIEELFSTLRVLSIQLREMPEQEPQKQEENRWENQLAEDTDKLNSLLNEQKSLMQQTEPLQQTANSNKKVPNLFLLIFGFVMALAGVSIVFLLQPLYGYSISIIGAILILLGFVIRSLPKKTIEAKAKLTELESNLMGINASIEAANQKIEADKQMLKAEQNEMNKRNAAFKLQEDYNKTEQALIDVLSPFGAVADTDQCIELAKQLRLAFKKTGELQTAISTTQSLLANEASREEIEQELAELGELPQTGDARLLGISDKRKRLNHLTMRITDLKTERSSISTEVRTAYRGKKTVPQIECEIRDLENELKSQEQYCSALSCAYDVLKDAFTEMMGSFGPALNKRTADIFSALTCGNYNDTIVSKDLAISAENKDTGNLISWEYLSDGTVDQAYLALRLAVCELITQDHETLPILLDDPFRQYDDTRVAKGFEFLKEYSRNRQILLFTCRNSEKQLAKSTGASLINII